MTASPSREADRSPRVLAETEPRLGMVAFMTSGVRTSDLVRLLQAARVDLSTEDRAQADLNTYLAARLPLGCALTREVRLSARDRPDFLIDDRIVVEVKLKRRWCEHTVVRQLERYAEHPQVEALILASNQALALPPMVGGKPLSCVSLGRGWL